MLTEHGPLVTALGSFGLGFVASLTPRVFSAVPSTVAIFGASEGTSRWRRAALSAIFVLGVVALFVPLGLFAELMGRMIGVYALWSPVTVVGMALLCTALALSMFGAFELGLPARLGKKVAAVGGAGFRGAFAMGLVVGFNTASGTVPFLLGLGTVIVSSRTAGLGTVAIGSFGLGLGALFFLAGAFAVRLPKGGAWTRATPWISGVGLTYLAFAHLRERFPAIADFVRDPHYALGIVAGALLVMGIALGLGHLLATRGGSTLGRFAKPLGLASILPAVIGGALFFSWLPHEHGNAPPITWLTNEEQGRAAATAAGKPVIVSFNAQWCCREIERDTFPDPRVREEAKRFIAIAVDATDDELPDTKRLQEKYRIIGLPTVIIFDSAGREVSRVDSFVQPAELLAQMKKVPR